MIRLDFPGYTGENSLEEIGWDEWFQKFDESKLALLVQDSTARGQQSNFNKLIGRETAQARSRGESKGSRRKSERASTSRTRSSSSKKGVQKADRGSTRGRRTESARGRTSSRRRAA